MNQEKYLKNKKLYHVYYNQNKNHDHCAFCVEKFSSKYQIGYCTIDYYYWICEKCFDDFKNIFNWRVVK